MRVETYDPHRTTRDHHREAREEKARIARSLRTVMRDDNPWPPHEMQTSPRWARCGRRSSGHRLCLEGVR